MVGTRPRSMSAGATWRNAMQSKADVRQRAASRHCHLPRRCSVKGTPENSPENRAGTQVTSASCVKERAPRAARYATNSSIVDKESNAYLKKNRKDVESVKALAVVTSDALADSALKRSEELLREFAALDLAEDICQIPEEEDIYQLPEEQDNHVQSIEELGSDFASRGRVETVEVPMELFDMLVESWKKYRSTMASIEDGEAKNDGSIKVRRPSSPDSGRSSGSTTLNDTDSEVGSVYDSNASPASCFRSPRGECVSQCILGGTQSSTASSEHADGVKILSSPVRTMRSGISTPWSGHSAPQPSQPPTNVFRVQSSSVHMPTRVFTPNTAATSKITSQLKCTTFRQTISITNTVHIYTAC